DLAEAALAAAEAAARAAGWIAARPTAISAERTGWRSPEPLALIAGRLTRSTVSVSRITLADTTGLLTSLAALASEWLPSPWRLVAWHPAARPESAHDIFNRFPAVFGFHDRFVVFCCDLHHAPIVGVRGKLCDAGPDGLRFDRSLLELPKTVTAW